MSEIEKMYARAMIKPLSITVCGIDEQIINYPPFTAEKQIELIKWLSKRCFYIEISEMADKSYGIAFKYQPADEYKNEQSECFTNKNFAEALAESTNYIWQDLTEEERNQIREVLE